MLPSASGVSRTLLIASAFFSAFAANAASTSSVSLTHAAENASLIETLPAAFEMDEILYELREHAAGLNAGRWDYIFSYLKTFRRHADRVLPERGQVTMTQPFLKAYSELLIQTCHRRGAHAMGGMAAQIPIKDDPAANEAAMAAIMNIEGFRALGSDVFETVVNKSEKVKDTKKKNKGKDLDPKKRKAGTVYQTPKGAMTWTGTGWLPQ